MDYSAFGEEINSGVGQRTSSQGFNANNNLTQKYALTERDKATGLDHTWFRKNENKAGRWTSPDPYNGSMNLGNPQSFNRYSYVENEPTNFVDPSGLNAVTFYCYDLNTYWHIGERSGVSTTTICGTFGGGGYNFGGGSTGGTEFGGGGGGGRTGGGIETGGGGGDDKERNKGKKAVYSEAKLKECLKKISVGVLSLSFDRKTGGSFTGVFSGLGISLSTNTNVSSKNSKELGVMLSRVSSKNYSSQSGVTLGSQPSGNFIASDVASNSKLYTDMGVMGLFIHELGNSIGAQIWGNDAFNKFGLNGMNNNDKDFGTNLEACVFNGIVGLRTGRVGSYREF